MFCCKNNKQKISCPYPQGVQGSLTINLMSFIINFRDKCSKQNMKNTFWENIFVYKNFLSTVKKMSCIENIRFWGESNSVYGKC